jgi:uncharacterized protein YbjT (DUF2867 family)
MKIAVTGATGYVGGRLVPHLIAEGHHVVCVARNPGKLADRPWIDDVDVVQADLLTAPDLAECLAGCDAAFYLVHSMGSEDDFESADLRAARRFAHGASEAGVKRIVYLGGLGSDEEALSPHLSSRHDVGATLATTDVAVTEFRAAVIIGSGSVSFEMLRHLTQVLPIMTTPRWVRTKCQPIAIRDVLSYLVAGLDETAPGRTIYEIGGPDVVSYEEMMQTYASVAGLRRRVILPVPVLSPGLSSLWVGLVTPLPVKVARPLVDSLRNEVIVHDSGASVTFDVEPLPFAESVRLAINVADGRRAPTRWTDAESSPALPMPADPSWSGGTVYEDVRSADVDATAADLFEVYSKVGGETGYFGYQWAWHVRGIIDTVVGGVGLRRGRRHPTELRNGDAVDFWRVVSVSEGQRLELSAEMKLPGDAWLVWSADDHSNGATLTQMAFFIPRGLFGRLYWLALWPFHGKIFGGMLRNIANEAVSLSSSR